jgi:hypothetical protein
MRAFHEMLCISVTHAIYCFLVPMHESCIAFWYQGLSVTDLIHCFVTWNKRGSAHARTHARTHPCSFAPCIPPAWHLIYKSNTSAADSERRIAVSRSLSRSLSLSAADSERRIAPRDHLGRVHNNHPFTFTTYPNRPSQFHPRLRDARCWRMLTYADVCWRMLSQPNLASHLHSTTRSSVYLHVHPSSIHLHLSINWVPLNWCRRNVLFQSFISSAFSWFVIWCRERVCTSCWWWVIWWREVEVEKRA